MDTTGVYSTLLDKWIELILVGAAREVSFQVSFLSPPLTSEFVMVFSYPLALGDKSCSLSLFFSSFFSLLFTLTLCVASNSSPVVLGHSRDESARSTKIFLSVCVCVCVHKKRLSECMYQWVKESECRKRVKKERTKRKNSFSSPTSGFLSVTTNATGHKSERGEHEESEWERREERREKNTKSHWVAKSWEVAVGPSADAKRPECERRKRSEPEREKRGAEKKNAVHLHLSSWLRRSYNIFLALTLLLCAIFLSLSPLLSSLSLSWAAFPSGSVFCVSSWTLPSISPSSFFFNFFFFFFSFHLFLLVSSSFQWSFEPIHATFQCKLNARPPVHPLSSYRQLKVCVCVKKERREKKTKYLKYLEWVRRRVRGSKTTPASEWEMFYTHNHLCHLSSRERHTNNSHLCILLSCSSDKSSPHSSHVCESSAFVSPNEQLDECLTSPSTESSSSPMSPCVDNLSSHHNNWSLLTKCHSSCKYTCSVYTHSHTSSSSPSPCTRDQCKSYCQSNNMQRYTDITSTCNRKSNNNGTFNSFYKHTLIWSLLVSSFILLPLVNASSINTFSSSSVHVNPSSSSSSLSTASKSSPLTMTASGVSSSSSSSSNTDTRNAASGPWTNQYQETNPLSTFTATSSSSSSSHQNSNANLIINSNQFSWLTREAISEVKRVFNERIHKYNGMFDFFLLPCHTVDPLWELFILSSQLMSLNPVTMFTFTKPVNYSHCTWTWKYTQELLLLTLFLLLSGKDNA